MKKIIGLIIALYGLNANASWMQKYCSDAEGATVKNSGHDINEMYVSKKAWTSGKMVLTKLMLDTFNEVDFEMSAGKMIHSEHYNSCDGSNPGETGIAEGKSVSHTKLTLKYKDGSLFDPSIVGVSKDRSSVEAYLICKQLHNGLILCPPNN